MSEALSLAMLEVSNLSPALMVVDRCAKAAGVRVIGVESTDGAAQCIKLLGSVAAVQHAADEGVKLARQMGAESFASVIPAPVDVVRELADCEPVFIPALGCYDHRKPRGDRSMSVTTALGLLETQGLVAALHATDDMLKSANVELVGKEKIGAAYVTIMIRGDVAAVQNAIETGAATVERLGGKLILSDVIARPHADLAALLPTS